MTGATYGDGNGTRCYTMFDRLQLRRPSVATSLGRRDRRLSRLDARRAHRGAALRRRARSASRSAPRSAARSARSRSWPSPGGRPDPRLVPRLVRRQRRGLARSATSLGNDPEAHGRRACSTPTTASSRTRPRSTGDHGGDGETFTHIAQLHGECRQRARGFRGRADGRDAGHHRPITCCRCPGCSCSTSRTTHDFMDQRADRQLRCRSSPTVDERRAISPPMVDAGHHDADRTASPSPAAIRWCGSPGPIRTPTTPPPSRSTCRSRRTTAPISTTRR